MAPDFPPLSELAAGIWQELSEACQKPEHAWRLPVLSTLNGDHPDSRTLVLRQIEPLQQRFSCHTDLRSDKVHQLEQNPHAAWLFYDPVQRVQLRIQGTITMHHDDDVANQLWEKSDPVSLKLYLGSQTPGAVVEHPDSNTPAQFLKRAPTREECQQGRKYFCVLQTRVLNIDWMKLRHTGNLRAFFDWSSGELEASWLIP